MELKWTEIFFWVGAVLTIATPIAHALATLADALAERAARTSSPDDDARARALQRFAHDVIAVLDFVSDNLPTIRRGTGARK